MTSDYDLPLGENALAQLNALAEAQLAAEREVLKKEQELEQANNALKDISHRQIPELLEELGITQFKTQDGLTIEIKEKIVAGLSKANLAPGIRWLEENGLGSLVKSKMVVYAPKGSPELLDDLKIEASDRGLDHEEKFDVHPMSLAAAVKELLEEGKEVPLELLGVLRIRSSKIKVKK